MYRFEVDNAGLIIYVKDVLVKFKPVGGSSYKGFYCTNNDRIANAIRETKRFAEGRIKEIVSEQLKKEEKEREAEQVSKKEEIVATYENVKRTQEAVVILRERHGVVFESKKITKSDALRKAALVGVSFPDLK